VLLHLPRASTPSTPTASSIPTLREEARARVGCAGLGEEGAVW